MAGSGLGSSSIYAEVAAERPRTNDTSLGMEKSGSDAANNTFPSPPLVGPPLGLSLSPRCDDAGDGELDRDAWYLSAYGKELCLSVRAVKGEGCPCLMRTVSVLVGQQGECLLIPSNRRSKCAGGHDARRKLQTKVQRKDSRTDFMPYSSAAAIVDA
jgi:hypothetical protein